MKLLILVGAMVLSTTALAQNQTSADEPFTFGKSKLIFSEPSPIQLPGYGFVVYDQAGDPVKAFGPETPFKTDNGSIKIIGGDFPANWTVKTEDTPTYLKALTLVSKAESQPESDYTKKIRELVASIDQGAAYVKDTLCKNPSRPSTIRVEFEGGFSLGVHGSITSTVDWDLEKICPVVASGEFNAPALRAD